MDAAAEELHNSWATATEGEMSARTPIPHYYLYGRLEDDAEAEVELDFLHIEPIRKRSGVNNWTIEPHAHPHHMQLLYVGAGGGLIDIERRSFAIEAPCLMTVPVAAVHQIRFEPETDGWVVTAAEPFVAQAVLGDARLVEATRRGGVFPLADTGLDPELVDAGFNGLLREFVYSAPGRRPAIMAHFITVLVSLLRAQAREAMPRLPVDDRSYALVVGYRDLIERHYREERRLEFYAARLAVTPARLNAACRARLGTTASRLLHDRIVTEAKRCLIYTAMSVAEIGYALGFDDPAYFSRFFSKRVGEAPGRLRETIGRLHPRSG
jgi:AraC family transcriptional activator of pobA